MKQPTPDQRREDRINRKAASAMSQLYQSLVSYQGVPGWEVRALTPAGAESVKRLGQFRWLSEAGAWIALDHQEGSGSDVASFVQFLSKCDRATAVAFLERKLGELGAIEAA